MPLIAEIVNWADVGGSVVAGAVAAITLTIVVSLGIRGMAKYVDYGQEGRITAAYAALAIGGLSVLATVVLIVLGIYLMVAG